MVLRLPLRENWEIDDRKELPFDSAARLLLLLISATQKIIAGDARREVQVKRVMMSLPYSAGLCQLENSCTAAAAGTTPYTVADCCSCLCQAISQAL